MTWLVVGAGFTGATIAERMASAGERVVVCEQRPFLGGSAADYRAEDGLLIQRFGPHVFHTNSEKVWQYVNRFGEWRAIKYRVAANIGGARVPLPLDFRVLDYLIGRAQAALPAEPAPGFNEVIMSQVSAMKTDLKASLTARYGLGARVGVMQLRRDFPALADWAIEHVFRAYNEKHWGMPLEEVPASVLARLPFVVGEQEAYFTDKYQAVPALGYTRIIERMLDHPNITVEVGAEVNGRNRFNEPIIWTGSPDAFFGEAGALPYRSVAFTVFRGGPEQTKLNLASPYATYTYPTPHEHTRSTEMLHINGWPDPTAFSGGSALVSDFPRAYVPGKNDPFYPIPLEQNIRRAQEYAARRPKNVWFAGRLGSYQYLNMDQAIAQALALFERIRAT